MSPEKLINGIDPNAAPFIMGMVVKIKDFVAVKALTAAVVMAFSIGIFYSQTNAMIDKVDKFTTRLEKIEEKMILLQEAQIITSNNVEHLSVDIKEITAQVGEIISNSVKIRRQ